RAGRLGRTGQGAAGTHLGRAERQAAVCRAARAPAVSVAASAALQGRRCGECAELCLRTLNRTRTSSMALHKPYQDVPGTTIFDAEQSRKGYWLNQFCMSLMKAENRERFKANERAYLDEWAMSEEQKQGVLARDLNRCIAAGGNIYFLAKLGATLGKSFQQM